MLVFLFSLYVCIVVFLLPWLFFSSLVRSLLSSLAIWSSWFKFKCVTYVPTPQHDALIPCNRGFDRINGLSDCRNEGMSVVVGLALSTLELGREPGSVVQTHLYVEKHPNILTYRMSQPLQEINQPSHRLTRLSGRFERRDILPRAICNSVFLSKTPLKRGVLHMSYGQSTLSLFPVHHLSGRGAVPRRN